MMNRRDLMRILGLGTAGAAVSPRLLKRAWKEFDRTSTRPNKIKMVYAIRARPFGDSTARLGEVICVRVRWGYIDELSKNGFLPADGRWINRNEFPELAEAMLRAGWKFTGDRVQLPDTIGRLPQGKSPTSRMRTRV